MDGVYRKDDEGKLTFTQTPPPREVELKALAETIHRRLVGLMKRRGMLREVDPNEEKQLDALAACGQLALTPCPTWPAGTRCTSPTRRPSWWTNACGK